MCSCAAVGMHGCARILCASIARPFLFGRLIRPLCCAVPHHRKAEIPTKGTKEYKAYEKKQKEQAKEAEKKKKEQEKERERVRATVRACMRRENDCRLVCCCEREGE